MGKLDLQSQIKSAGSIRKSLIASLPFDATTTIYPNLSNASLNNIRICSSSSTKRIFFMVFLLVVFSWIFKSFPSKLFSFFRSSTFCLWKVISFFLSVRNFCYKIYSREVFFSCKSRCHTHCIAWTIRIHTNRAIAKTRNTDRSWSFCFLDFKTGNRKLHRMIIQFEIIPTQQLQLPVYLHMIPIGIGPYTIF